MGAVGIDVGGTSIVGSVVEEDGTYSTPIRIPTPKTGASDVCQAVGTLIRQLQPAPGSSRAAGVCLPGTVDTKSGIGLASANLGWEKAPLRDLLEEASGRPVLVAQDVRSGAAAESRWGIQIPSFYYVAIGTGVAAATIVDGSPFSLSPWAGEIGQYRVPSPFGAGTVRLEEVLSGPGIAHLGVERGVVPRGSSARDVIELAASNLAAQDVLTEAFSLLADVLAPAIYMTGALPIVIGGGPSKGGAAVTQPLYQELTSRLGPLLEPVPVLTARLGDMSQMIGAAALVFEVERK